MRPHRLRGRHRRYFVIKLDIVECIYVGWGGRSAVAFHKKSAGVNSPRVLRNFSSYQRRVAIEGSASDCNVCLALGKVQCPLLHDQLDRDARMPRMKAVEEAGFDDALTDRYGAGQLDQAGGAVVESC